MNPATMEMTEYGIPWDDARPRRIARTSDGAIWYVDYGRGSLGRLDPVTGGVREWPAPGGPNARPDAMTVDDRDRLWFVETAPDPNVLVASDPVTGEYVERAEIPSGGGAVRHMVYHAPTGAVWFGTDANTIGRAMVR